MNKYLHGNYIQGLLAAGILASSSAYVTAATVAHYRLEEGVDSAAVTNAIEFGGNTDIDADTITGTPTYSSNVPNKPGFAIFDGTNPVPLSNNLSLYAGGGTANESVATPYDAIFDLTDFTVEFFASITTEFGGYGSVVKRAVDGTSRLNFDFEHGNNTALYGSLRVLSTNGGGNTISRFGQTFVDAPGNTDNPADYPGGDPFPSGNGIDDYVDINGSGNWHHFAFTYDSTTTTGTTYLDGNLVATFNVADGAANPVSGWEFGRIAGVTGDAYVDEFRISDTVLAPADFLHIAVIPEPSFSTLFLGTTCLLGILLINRRLKSATL